MKTLLIALSLTSAFQALAECEVRHPNKVLINEEPVEFTSYLVTPYAPSKNKNVLHIVEKSEKKLMIVTGNKFKVSIDDADIDCK